MARVEAEHKSESLYGNEADLVSPLTIARRGAPQNYEGNEPVMQ